jgi:YfiH family protein
VSLYRDASGLWKSTLLDGQTWLAHAFGTARATPPYAYLLLKQVHGTTVRHARDHQPDCAGDALIAAEPGQFVAVKSADCIPLLLADPVTRQIAAVHGGWRGTQAGIATAAVQALCAAGAHPEDLLAAAGPCIRVCCFEVDADVAVLFRDIFPERTDLWERTHLDLIEATRRQLSGCGLLAHHLDLDGPCTVCGGREFHSWRRDRQTGARMESAIGRRD